MSLAQTVDQVVEYPESDGKPMGETDLHRDWMVRILEILRYRYRGQRVYVASDLIVYYEEGNPTKSVVPDDFVVKDCDPGRRRTFKIWEEGKAPHVVFEVTSRGSRREDQIFKPQIYARLGVLEYFLYDPTSDYLRPPLQGFRLVAGTYQKIEPDEAGHVECQVLGITLGLTGGELVMRDLETGDVLRTVAEANGLALEAAEAALATTNAARDKESLARQAAEAAREREAAARQVAETARDKEAAARAAAEARAAELEAELQKLRDQLIQRDT
jgi:Uma2 family endonuclease